MDEDRKLPVFKHQVKIGHPDDDSREFVLDDVLVIPPDADWGSVPNLTELDGTTAVLLNFKDFTNMVLHANGEYENYQPFILN